MKPKKSIIFKQADFLYELEWDEKVDDTFIQVLSYQARLGYFIAGKKMRDSIRMAQSFIQKKHGKHFSAKYFLKKLVVLETRYDTFGWMLTLPGFSWNQTTNVVTASDDLWTEILKDHVFGWAYRKYGDSKWEDLQTIFSKPAIQANPQNEEVIVVSSEDDEYVKPARAPPPVPIPETAVINISSDSSSLHFNVWDLLTHNYDSEGSLNTENSTTHSRFGRTSAGPSPLKPKEALMPKYKQFPGVYGVSSSGSNVPWMEDNEKDDKVDGKKPCY